MSIASFLSRLWATIKRMFDGFDDELQKAVHIGVTIVENIKNLIDSPAADVMTEIIPGEIDDHLKNWLRLKLPQLLQQLKLADETLLNDADIIKQAAQKVQNMSGSLRSSFLHNLSILIAEIVADGKLTWSDGVYVVQWYYQNRFKHTD